MANFINVDKEFNVIGLGEVMLRLSPVGKERISQSETFEKKAGGSELNVVAGISQLGLRTGIITKLPDNEIGKFIKNKIRYSGISDDYIVYDSSKSKRLGVYYYESGAYPRVPTVVYDRANSSFVNFNASELDEKVYEKTKVFHISGITLALSEHIRNEAVEMIKRFKKAGALISFDVNYRATLWDEDTARTTITSILPYVDILFISEETLRRMFKKTGTLKEIHAGFGEEYPNLQVIFSTMREATSPTRHTFTSLAYDCKDKSFSSEEAYRDIEVVDRIGSGDAYVAGALFGLLKFGKNDDAVRFGNAMAALKNTIPGDMTACDYNDIVRVIDAHTKGQASEMVR
ncbi:MAG: sugar kinase [Clostridia bacterium]|nr:sugar kinase [Clostridia bacterium]